MFIKVNCFQQGFQADKEFTTFINPVHIVSVSYGLSSWRNENITEICLVNGSCLHTTDSVGEVICKIDDAMMANDRGL